MRRTWITLTIAAAVAFVWWWFAADQRRESTAPAAAAAATGSDTSLDTASQRAVDAGLGVERREVAGTSPDRAAPMPASVPGASGALLVQVVWEDDSPACDVGVAVVERRPGRLDARRVGITDDRGAVRFDDLPVATHAVSTRGSKPVEIETAARSTITLELRVPRGFGIEGRVLDAFGAPVADAVIWLMPGGGQLDHRRALPVARSRSDGQFRVEQAAVGVRTFVSARAAGYGPSVWRVMYAPDRTEGDSRLRGIELRLTGAIGTIAGRCVRQDGSPVAGATVHAVPLGLAWLNDDGDRSWPGHEHWVNGNGDGAFRFDDVAVGTWRLTARADGLWFEPAETTLATALGVQQLELFGLPAATLEGVVRDPDGEPIDGAYVRVQSQRSARVNSGPDGRWAIHDLPAARLKLRCFAAGYETSMRELETVAGEVTKVDFELVPRPRLFGVARLASGESVAGWRLGVLPAQSEDPSWVPSDVLPADGRFELFVDEPVPHMFYVSDPDTGFPSALRETGSFAPSEEAIELIIPDRARADSWLVGSISAASGDQRHHLTLVRGKQRQGLAPDVVETSSGAFRIGPLPIGDYSLLVGSRQLDGSRYGTPSIGQPRFGPFRVPISQTIDVGVLQLPAAAQLEIETSTAPGCTPQAVRLEWRGRTEANTAGLLQLDATEPTTIDIVPGDYVFTIWGEGFLSVERELSVLPPPAPPTRLEATLRAGQRLPIRLELPAGEERATFTIREAGSGRVAHEDEFGTDEARAVNRYPVLGLGRHLVECVGASGDRYVAEFEIESLTPTREPRRIGLARR